MLHNVPNTMNRMIRNVVENHPNSLSCEYYRKHVLRNRREEGEEEEMPFGEETVGGAGVLDSTDEEDYEFEYLGLGWALPAEAFQPSKITDHKDANIGFAPEQTYLIVPQAQTGEEGFFIPRTHDVMYLQLYLGENGPDGEPLIARIAYEIVRMETTTNIPPYTNRWVCNRRDDLHLTAGGLSLMDEINRIKREAKAKTE